MATLELPHWEATPSIAHRIIEGVGKFPFCRRFFLGGGTSLALRLGHRVSHDFDFFSDSDRVQEDTRDEILESLKSSFPDLEIATNTLGDLTLSIMGHDVGFYSYRYSMLETGDDLLGIKVAGLLDVASMKLDAIAGRGARRDFYDLYFLAHIFPLERLFEYAEQKYTYTRDFPMMVLPYLNDFRNADEQSQQVDLLTPLDWEDVKIFFRAETKRLSQLWFLPPDR